MLFALFFVLFFLRNASLGSTFGCKNCPTNDAEVLAVLKDEKSCKTNACCHGDLGFWRDKAFCEFYDEENHVDG